MIRFLVIIFFLSSNAFGFEQRIISCPPQQGNKYETLYKTFQNEDNEAKISMVRKKDEKPSYGVNYYSLKDPKAGDLIVWIRVFKLKNYEKPVIWRGTFIIKKKELLESVAILTDEELKNIANINKENPKQIDKAKFDLFEKVLKAKRIENSLLTNCKIEK